MTYKKKVKNRIIVSLAAFVLLMLAVLPFAYMTVSAAGTTPTQVTSSNYSSLGLTSSYVGYYAIENADQMMTFVTWVNAGNTSYNAVLIADIDLTGKTWVAMTSYSGIFDGRGHTISNMSQGLADEHRPGFVNVLNGTVKNVIFKSANVFVQSDTGLGVIAYNNSGTISGCMVIDSTIQLGNYAGLGLIAGKNLSGGVIENCGVVNSSAIRRYGGSSNQTVGGITESNDGTVENCYTYNVNLGNGTSANGALISRGNAPVNSYYYTTDTTVDTYGTSKSAEAFASGEVAYLLQGDESTKVWGQTMDSVGYPVIGNAENGAKVYQKFYCDGTLSGYSNTENVTEHKTYNNGFCAYCDAYEPALLVTAENYSDLGLAAEHVGYYAVGNAGQLYWIAAVVNNVSGYGDMPQTLGINFALIDNITVNTNVQLDDGTLNTDAVDSFRVWTPIGCDGPDTTNSEWEYAFGGIFDGNGKTVSGLYHNDASVSTGYFIGLFGAADKFNGPNDRAVIKNVTLTDSYLRGRSYVGGIVGMAYYTTITNCTNDGRVMATTFGGGIAGYAPLGMDIIDCVNTGIVRGGDYIGGIVGKIGEDTVENCVNFGYVSGGNYIGGITGTAESARITNCENRGDVEGSGNIGGISGERTGYSGSIVNCYNTASIKGNYNVGGVAGRISTTNRGTVSNSYNIGSVNGGSSVGGVAGWVDSKVTISNCYNTGSVTSSGDYVGGICGTNTGTFSNSYNTGAVSGSAGYIGGAFGSNTGTVSNCYYLDDDTVVMGGIGGADVSGQAEAKTTEQFASGEVTYLLQGEQSTQIWGQNIDNGNTREYFPVFSTANVYIREQYCDGGFISFSNTAYTIAVTHFEDPTYYNINGFCTYCDAYQPAILVTTENYGSLGLIANRVGYYAMGNAGQLCWFAQLVNGGTTTVNGVVIADINAALTQCKYLSIGVSRTHPYSGDFDGGRHTITLALEGDNASDCIALFECIGGATIHDLHITGNIYAPASSSYNQFAAGIVSHVLSGTNTIERVTCDVIITSDISGDGTHGGLVGIVEGDALLTLNNCGFSGAINGPNTFACGGFIGWNNSQNLVITNCYQAGTFNLYAERNATNATIYRGNTAAKTLENVYYLNAIGTEQSTYKSADAFASGEVAYLLQGDQTEQVWGQNIDNGNTVETLPVLYGATVYTKMYCDNSAIVGYSNTEGVVVHTWDHDAPEFTWAEDHTSLTVTLICKIDAAHSTLSGTTTDISANTTDPEWIYYTGTVILDSVSHTDTAKVENEIISVYISWTEFTFVYTVEWNPETLQYEGTGWEPISENGGEITVRNDGNVDVNVSFEYVETEATVTGEFVDGANVAVTSPVALAVGAETKVKLTLYGEPVETFISGTLGNVTVTVDKADTASLP